MEEPITAQQGVAALACLKKYTIFLSPQIFFKNLSSMRKNIMPKKASIKAGLIT